MSTYKSLIPSKRKSDENVESLIFKKPVTGRNPLGVLVANSVPYQLANTPSTSGEEETYWNVVWRKPQFKKNKTWDGDGVLVVCGSKMTLRDQDNKIISTGVISQRTGVIEPGASLSVGGKDIEIDTAIQKEEYLSGRCFGSSSTSFIPLPPPSKGFQAPKPLARTSVGGSSKPAAPLGAKLAIPTRKPTIMESKNSVKPMDHPTDADYKVVRYYTVNWRKPQTKKHKTWDGDAYLVVTGTRGVMQEAGGRILGTATWDAAWLEGSLMFIGGKEVEIDNLITEAEFHQQCSGLPPPEPEPEGPRHSPSVPKHHSPVIKVGAPRARTNFTPKVDGPLHDPDQAGALVLPRPTPAHQTRAGKSGYTIEDVVVDPVLATKLRPHQREGVIFMYEAVMGMRRHEGFGAILADEMGLGKTLQASSNKTIALLWTLLRQTPYRPREPIYHHKGEIGKAMIVCPVSLVGNWRSEIWKWLGRDRMGVFVAEETNKIKQFLNSRGHDVLIIGYEKLRSVIDMLVYSDPMIDLIICDEGHRLKSSNNKTSQMFTALKTKRRIILSGTPIQNDLSEFWSMAEFCNPGLLGQYNDFKRIYEQPIVRARAPNCTEKNKEIGEARSSQLSSTAKSFVLRRTADILTSYLPPKYEYVAFIRPTKVQIDLMQRVLTSQAIGRALRNGMAQALEMMSILGKICTSPVLLKTTAKPPSQWAPEYQEIVSRLPRHMEESDSSFSGKLIALMNLLDAVRKITEEKVIVVSQFTKTLDVVEAICTKMRWTRERLDGTTPQNERDSRVQTFNRTNQAECFIFLLSLKAGGVGLNLVGASRLILLDSSWNPAHDLQAMARIHRDGQKRPVHIYRFLTVGTIDEKVYMRQVIKTGLTLMAGDGDGKAKGDSFTHDELRDLFRIHTHTPCHTHDLLDCDCAASRLVNDEGDTSDGEEKEEKDDEQGVLDEDTVSEAPHRGFMLASQVEIADITARAKKMKKDLAILDEWTHVNCMGPAGRLSIKDPVLRDVIRGVYDKQTPAETGEGESSRGSKILTEIDMDKIQASSDSDDGGQNRLTNMDGVPEGAVTFLFTKCSM
ncbi:hypothetical protein DACRYDRAFT_109677 [Dacryopinax primogenitus]|uniref:Uncharacterized protein n=1 Tax=Dacryopinax primogenitus (strain DJM 731) TaxID=1858805 RepID=M5FVE1_DACPD|nr:uncharacterized protein DACRYDRAFT_109677 [Dacryopinax primogenitus]EJT99579.1 hypothetical protein DACRYDRAFT_109677 [Dacryopinax primogenitus]